MTIPQYSVYSCSKRALLGFSLTARAELDKDHRPLGSRPDARSPYPEGRQLDEEQHYEPLKPLPGPHLHSEEIRATISSDRLMPTFLRAGEAPTMEELKAIASTLRIGVATKR